MVTIETFTNGGHEVESYVSTLILKHSQNFLGNLICDFQTN
jgi:hypothetical protein